jgi:YggT family protein
MFVLSNFLLAIADLLQTVLYIYMWVIIIRALISWVNPDPYNPIVKFLYQVTEPVLYRVRRIIPYMGGLDLSPIVVILAIYFINNFILKTLVDIALRMKAGGG